MCIRNGAEKRLLSSSDRVIYVKKIIKDVYKKGAFASSDALALI